MWPKALCLLLLLSCGPSEPPPDPTTTRLWQILEQMDKDLPPMPDTPYGYRAVSADPRIFPKYGLSDFREFYQSAFEVEILGGAPNPIHVRFTSPSGLDLLIPVTIWSPTISGEVSLATDSVWLQWGTSEVCEITAVGPAGESDALLGRLP